MKLIQVLGLGCPRCRKLAEAAEAAARAAGIEYRLEKVEDLQAIVRFGVVATPALVVDGLVKAAGRVPGPEELKAMLA